MRLLHDLRKIRSLTFCCHDAHRPWRVESGEEKLIHNNIVRSKVGVKIFLFYPVNVPSFPSAAVVLFFHIMLHINIYIHIRPYSETVNNEIFQPNPPYQGKIRLLKFLGKRYDPFKEIRCVWSSLPG